MNAFLENNDIKEREYFHEYSSVNLSEAAINYINDSDDRETIGYFENNK